MRVEQNISKAVSLTKFMPKQARLSTGLLFFVLASLLYAGLSGDILLPALFLFEAVLTSLILKRMPRALPFYFLPFFYVLTPLPIEIKAGFGFFLFFIFTRLFSKGLLRPLILSVLLLLSLLINARFSLGILLFSSFLFLVSAFIILSFIDVPVKRVFGMSGLELFSLFIQAWLGHEEELEESFSEIAEKAFIPVYVISVGEHRLIIPYFHFGPFGSIGSSNFPAVLNEPVLHGPSTHDYNLIDRQEILKLIENLPHPAPHSSSLRVYKSAHLTALEFDDFVLLAVDSPEDIAPGIGFALQERTARRFGKQAVVFDQHAAPSSKIFWVEFGSREFKEWLAEVDQLRLVWEGDLTAVWQNRKLDSPELGSAGIWLGRLGPVYMVIIDGNGIDPNLRQAMEEKIKAMGLIPLICTTDTHEINRVEGVANQVSDRRLLDLLVPLKAEPAQAGIAMRWYYLSVFGQSNSYAVVLLTNFAASLLKYAAPLLLFSVLIAIGLYRFFV